MKDLHDFEIISSFEELCVYKEERWKSFVISRTSACALSYLNYIGGSKSHKYKDLKLSNYLSSKNENIPLETAKFITKTQSHMIETVK